MSTLALRTAAIETLACAILASRCGLAKLAGIDMPVSTHPRRPVFAHLIDDSPEPGHALARSTKRSESGLSRPKTLWFPSPRADKYREDHMRDTPVATIDPIPTVRDALSDEVSTQNLRLVDDIAALLRENDASGNLKSNETLMQSTILCCEMLQDRLEVCLSALKPLFKRASAADSDIGPIEMKELVAEFFTPRDPFVSDQLSEVITTIGAPDVLDKLCSKVERTRSHVLTRLGVEIDILSRRAAATESKFWQSSWFRKAMLFAEISGSIATVWFAYAWIRNPASYISVPMIVTGFLVYGFGRFRRYLEANF